MPMPTTPNNSLREVDQAQFFVSTPHWILHYGLVLLFVIVLSLILGAAFFKYPDKLKARFTLTSSTPPIELNANASGRISKIFVPNRHYVAAGSPVLLLESTADYEDILRLADYVYSFPIKDWRERSFDHPDVGLQLGELQALYVDLVLSVERLDMFKRNPYYARKREGLDLQLQSQQDRAGLLAKDGLLRREQLQLVRAQEQRDSLLHAQQLVSDERWEVSRANLLTSRAELIASSLAEKTLAQTRAELRNAQIDLEQSQRSMDLELSERVKGLIQQLGVALKEWKLKYLLIAPISGEVVFDRPWTVNQYVEEHSSLLSIIPNVHGEQPMVRVLVPMPGAGKIQAKQRVHLTCDSYPKVEYGYLIGQVERISPLPVVLAGQKFYNVEVRLSDGLRTNYGKELPAFLNLDGDAEIITEDLSMLQRILKPLRQLLYNSKR